MKNALVYLFAISLLINPALLMAQDLVEQFANIENARISNSVDLTLEQLCPSKNPDFTCHGTLAYINFGNGFSHNAVDNLISCEANEINPWEFAVAISTGDGMTTVQGQASKTDCDYPSNRTFFKEIDGQSWQAAINACINMEGGECLFIWKDNSGAYFLGRYLTLRDIRRYYDQMDQLYKGMLDQQHRTNGRILQSFR